MLGMLAYCGADGTVFRFQVTLVICWRLQLPAVPFFLLNRFYDQ